MNAHTFDNNFALTGKKALVTGTGASDQRPAFLEVELAGKGSEFHWHGMEDRNLFYTAAIMYPTAIFMRCYVADNVAPMTTLRRRTIFYAGEHLLFDSPAKMRLNGVSPFELCVAPPAEQTAFPHPRSSNLIRWLGVCGLIGRHD